MCDDFSEGLHVFHKVFQVTKLEITVLTRPERIYNPIMAMGFLAMFTFQLDNTKR